METKQQVFWKSSFGKKYTDRSTLTPAEVNKLYRSVNGVTRSAVNKNFIGRLKLDSILEVGCNVGNILRLLHKEGQAKFFYGVEIQPYAVQKAHRLSPKLNIIEGSALDLPFKDAYFDLVYTSGVLMHIHPRDIKTVLREIYRASKKYIWGFESYEDGYEETEYRGRSNCFWKANFAQMYQDLFPDLKLVKKANYLYKGQLDKVDQVFLLAKK